MAVPLDPITRKKLLLVKQLYQHAAVQAASAKSVVNRILALVGFDLANETGLKATVSALDASKMPQDSFQTLVQQADAALTRAGLGPVPDKANIQYVHTLRNDAQHKARYPSESDLSDCRTYTRDFLRKIMTNVWTLDFEKFTLVESIVNTKARQYLADAEIALAQGDHEGAVRDAAAGLTWALTNVRKSISGKLPRGGNLGVMMTDAFGSKTFPSTQPLDALQQMQDVIVYLFVGMDYAEYLRYERIAPTVKFMMAGNPAFVGRGYMPSRDEAEFVIAYCTNAVAQIEDAVGDIEKPFQ
jgi:hypothetical protein